MSEKSRQDVKKALTNMRVAGDYLADAASIANTAGDKTLAKEATDLAKKARELASATQSKLDSKVSG